jgi:type IV pilus assembly protein PilM
VTALARWWTSPPPSVGLEIAATRVTAVSIGRGGDPAVGAYATEALPPGAVVPSLTADNVVDRDTVAAAVGRVLQQAGNPRRVAMVVPDTAAKVSMVHFDRVPARPEELSQMIRWQVRKAVPFPIEGAQVAYAPSGPPEGTGGREFLVVVMRREVVEGYEAAVQAAGAYPGLVDLASFNVVNLVLAADRKSGGPGQHDWLLVHLTPQASTIAIVRTGDLVFYRNRLTDGQEALVELAHQTAMYYEDRLGGSGFDRVVLSASADALAMEAADVRQTLEERVRARVELVDPRAAARLTDRISVPQDDLVAMAAPLGVLLREAA